MSKYGRGHGHGSGYRHRGGRIGHLLNELRGSGTRETDKTPRIKIALAGNPNAGKTSLFNNITGQRQHIGNYPGVTVEKKTGYTYYKNHRIEIVDLPGTYSLTAYSPEEVVTRDYLLKDKPDLIVDVLDSTNLERNLYLCLQFRELGVPVIAALNMTDEAITQGINIDEEHLSKLLDIPMVKTVGTRGEGIEQLLDLVVESYQSRNGLNKRILNYGREIEQNIEKLIQVLEQDSKFAEIYTTRWIAIKLLEEDEDAIYKIREEHRLPQLVLQRAKEARNWVQKHFKEESVVVVGEQRYAYIHGAVHEAVKLDKKRKGRNFTENVDRIILNRYAGFFIFFFVMFLVYEFTFLFGNPLSDLIDIGFAELGNLVRTMIPPGAVQDLVVDGIIGGVGGVLVFLPLVLFLFMGLSFLEDSGYMARAAFVMDKFFHLFGMHGRSFIPFMIATGCSVPAVMSARTLVNPRDRKITILVTPIMMCGAKTPVIAMLVAAFFPKNGALIFWLVWLAAWLLAFVTAYTFRKTIFKGDASPFVMELPPYRFPTIRGIFTHMWEKSFMYVRKAGTTILAISIVVWFILYFPKPTEYSKDYSGQIEQLQGVGNYLELTSNRSNSDLGNNSILNEKLKELQKKHGKEVTNVIVNDEILLLNQEKAREEIENSLGGQIGKRIEPIFRPIGFDWRISVGLFAGFAAKEVIISTLGIVYGIGEANPDSEQVEEGRTPLKELLANDPAYNPAMALSMMFFVLIYVPCMAVMAVVKKELGSWKWPVFLAVYTFAFAWFVSFVIYQVSSLVGLA